MEVRGKVIAKPADRSGVSSNGPWKKAFLVIRYEEGQYPKDIVLSNMKKAEEFSRIRIGETGVFKFDATSRSANNGQWYCDLTCWAWTLDSDSNQQGPI